MLVLGRTPKRGLCLTLALLLSACGIENSDTRRIETQAEAEAEAESRLAKPAALDLSCDQAALGSVDFVNCESRNVARTLEATSEQLSPTFQARSLAQYAENLGAFVMRSISDPSWILPPAIGNSPATPLCAAGILPCVGDPFRYPSVDGPDGRTFYESEAEVVPVVYYDRACARISGRVWRPRGTSGKKLPAIVVKNGSVQANEQLYWWAVQPLVRSGYAVLTNDPRGQGLSDFAAPNGEQGGNFNGAVFHEGLVDDIDFLLSSPSMPYPHQERCEGTYPTQTNRFNPVHDSVDRDRVGVAGHSYGAAGATWIQSYDSDADQPWPGLLSSKNPVKAIVAWDALGSSRTPVSATATSLISTQAATAIPLVDGIVFPSGNPPKVSPRVPAMGFSSEYGFTPVPFLRDPPRDEHKQAYREWVQAGIPVYQLTVAGSTHLDYSLGPFLPATSWCPEIVNNACSGGWTRPLVTHYTLAWFDRYLKLPGESGFDDADDRLLNDALWADRLSFHFASARRFTTRGGVVVNDEDIRKINEAQSPN